MRKELVIVGGGVAFVRLAGMAAGLLLTAAIARVLGPNGVGSYGLAITLLAIAATPVSNGWATILLRATSRAHRSGTLPNAASSWSEVAGLERWGRRMAAGAAALLSMGLGLLILGPSGTGLLSFAAIGVLSAVLFFDHLSALRLAVLRGLDHPVWGQVPEMLLRPLLILSFFLLLTLLKPEAPRLFDLFLALLGAAALSALAGWFILWRKVPFVLRNATPEKHLKAWTYNASLLAINAGLVILSSQIDFLMVAMLRTSEDMGYYRVAMQLSLLSGFIYAALNMIAMQRFAALHTAGEMEKLQNSATFLARLAVLGALPLPLIFLIWGEPILEKLVGPGFSAALSPLMWLFGVQIMNASAGFANALLVMSNYENRIPPVTLAAIALNAVLCLSLIPSMGVMGAAISSFVALSLWNIVLMVMARRLTSVDCSIVRFP
jgi:O-antigen/teichoic acid export membrane protein